MSAGSGAPESQALALLRAGRELLTEKDEGKQEFLSGFPLGWVSQPWSGGRVCVKLREDGEPGQMCWGGSAREGEDIPGYCGDAFLSSALIHSCKGRFFQPSQPCFSILTTTGLR